MYAEDGESSRHATWLELFFDLVFVVAVAELGGLLRHDPTLADVAGYAGLFALVWWAWLGFSYHSDLFDARDLASQLAMIVVMFGVIVLSQTIPDALHGGSFAFAGAYLLLRVLYLALNVRTWLSATEARTFLTYWITFSAVGTAVWAMSLFVPEPGRFGLWISAFLLYVAGVGVVYLAFDEVPIQVSHFPERLGLFTILVLGETILAVAVGTEGTDWLLRSGLTALAGFAIAVTAWWLYFQHFDERTIDKALRDTENHWLKMRERMFVYVFGHYLVFVGIVTAGIGIENALEAAIHGDLMTATGRALVAGGLAAFLLGTTVIHRATPATLDDHVAVARVATAAAIVLGGIVGGEVPPFVAVGVIGLLMVGLSVFEGVDRARHAAADEVGPAREPTPAGETEAGRDA